MNTANNELIVRYFGFVLFAALPVYLFAILAAKGVILTREMAVLSLPLITLVPISVSVFLTYRKKNSVKMLLARALDFKRIKYKAWYLPIIFLLPVVFGLAFATMKLLSIPYPEQALPFAALLPMFFMFLLMSFAEEVGWMGYVFEPMQDKWGALEASIILGVLWGAMHIPLYIYVTPVMESQPIDPLKVAGLFVCLLAARVLLVWIYNNAGKSLFAAIVFHAMYNMSVVVIPVFGSAASTAIAAALMLIAAFLVVVLGDKEKYR